MATCLPFWRDARTGFEVLVLTNAMRPMMRYQKALKRLNAAHGGLLRFRVSLDDHRPTIHDAERGTGSFAKAMEGFAVSLPRGFQWKLQAVALAANRQRGASGLQGAV